jgi:hypothetical protein
MLIVGIIKYNVKVIQELQYLYKSSDSSDKTTKNKQGTWPSSQRGALACRRSQAGIPAMAVNQLPFWFVVNCESTAVHCAHCGYLSTVLGNTLCFQCLDFEPPRRAG